jgi:hypothetical protein
MSKRVGSCSLVVARGEIGKGKSEKIIMEILYTEIGWGDDSIDFLEIERIIWFSRYNIYISHMNLENRLKYLRNIRKYGRVEG